MAATKRSRAVWEHFWRFIKFRLLHISDSPHRIALGVALGLFIAWTPAFGFHILIAMILSMLLRANKFTALTFIWVCNPFTVTAIYYPNYLLGSSALGYFRPADTVESSAEQLQQMLECFNLSTGIFTREFWHNLLVLFSSKAAELWIGGLIIGSAVALFAYFATYYLIIGYRRANPHRRFLISQ